MTDVFLKCWSFFSQLTSIWDRYAYVADYKIAIFSVVFGLALLVGFYIFRLYFSMTFFYLYVTLCVLLLPRFLNWYDVVAFFSVSGVIFSFLMYKCNRFGSLLLCGIIAGMIGYMILPQSFFVAIFALLGLLISFFFPVHAICIFMALFGGLGLSSLYGYPDIAGAAVGAVFAVVQILLTRKQTLFENRYPAKIQYMIDSRKRAKA